MNLIFDIIEIHLPSLLFFVLFVFYVLMIAYRYIFHKQFNDIFELSVVIFLWCSLLSASYGGRTGKHIMFTILYDQLSEGSKLAFRIISNLFIVVTFTFLVPYAYECLSFSACKSTSILKIPYTIVDLPIIFTYHADTDLLPD